jgi:hypothetical protein
MKPRGVDVWIKAAKTVSSVRRPQVAERLAGCGIDSGAGQYHATLWSRHAASELSRSLGIRDPGGDHHYDRQKKGVTQR